MQERNICSRGVVILGELESFRNYKGFSIIFLKILDAIQRFKKVRIFLIPLSVTFLNTKILRFRFSVYFVLRNKMERSEMERNEMTVKN